MEVEKATVAIIGAGPIGLELAIALKQSEISFRLFDKEQVAQMIYNFPPQTTFFSSPENIGIAGIPIPTPEPQKCTRELYLAYIRSVVMAYQIEINSYETVTEISRIDSEEFRLKTIRAHQPHEYRVKYVMLATGSTSYPCQLNVPGELLEHVSNKMGDPHHYFQKRVLVVGGKNSAAEAALRSFHAGAHVTLAVRNTQFCPLTVKYWILPELERRIKIGEIRCFYQAQVEAIFPGRVLLKTPEQTVEIPIDFVIKAIGFKANMEFCKKLHVELIGKEEKPVFNPETMETTVKGVYVLGTITGGTQSRYRIFIENSHEHVEKIIKALSTELHIPYVEPKIQNRNKETSKVALEE